MSCLWVGGNPGTFWFRVRSLTLTTAAQAARLRHPNNRTNRMAVLPSFAGDIAETQDERKPQRPFSSAFCSGLFLIRSPQRCLCRGKQLGGPWLLEVVIPKPRSLFSNPDQEGDLETFAASDKVVSARIVRHAAPAASLFSGDVPIRERSDGKRPWFVKSSQPPFLPFSRHKLKHLSANLHHAPIRDPQDACGGERKVEDAAANPRSAVCDTNHYRFFCRRISNANSRAERQGPVGCRWQIPIEERTARCLP
jgi:hypothetical protein